MEQPQKPDIPKPEDLEELKLGNIRIWIPKGDVKEANKAKKLIDLYIGGCVEDTQTTS